MDLSLVAHNYLQMKFDILTLSQSHRASSCKIPIFTLSTPLLNMVLILLLIQPMVVMRQVTGIRNHRKNY